MGWHREHAEPWSVDHETARTTTWVGIADENDVIVAIAVQANGDDRLDEIAALCTAAPDLLASVIELLGPLEAATTALALTGKFVDEAAEDAFDRARAAIAKAKGKA